MQSAPNNNAEEREDEIPTEMIQAALAVDPDDVYKRGYEAWQAQDYDRALIDFSWLVMTQPTSWRAHLALGTVFKKQQYASY